MAVLPQQALERLKQGNERFVRGIRSAPSLTEGQRNQLLDGQKPFATILTCSDSRVPVELVFDQGFGDLFVIRVAGNVVAPSLVGSVEYAASVLDTRLCVVMGHSDCGAVKATLDSLKRGGSGAPTDNIRDIIERIRPATQIVLDSGTTTEEPEVLSRCIRANVRISTTHLRHGSRMLERLSMHGQIVIVGALYDIATGRTDFFDIPDVSEH